MLQSCREKQTLVDGDISDARASSSSARNRRGEVVGKAGTDSMVYALLQESNPPSTETSIRIATLSAVNVSFDSPRPARSQDRLFPFLEDQQHFYVVCDVRPMR